MVGVVPVLSFLTAPTSPKATVVHKLYMTHRRGIGKRLQTGGTLLLTWCCHLGFDILPPPGTDFICGKEMLYIMDLSTLGTKMSENIMMDNWKGCIVCMYQLWPHLLSTMVESVSG